MEDGKDKERRDGADEGAGGVVSGAVGAGWRQGRGRRDPGEIEPEELVTLSLISHTNVGKTTLARTLLRRDVGEALDRAHVTMQNVAYTMIRRDGAVLRLWDTPGFGDTARLLKRLRGSANPVGWFLSEVIDRFRDRPLFCAQQAVKNVREEADIVLYLVNASEDPAGAGYVALEMEVLGWMGKPVFVLLNQTGAPRPAYEQELEVRLWREALDGYGVVTDVAHLDAYSRCWVQEIDLLERIGRSLPPERREVFGRLSEGWREDKLGVFRRTCRAFARQLAGSVSDGEQAPEEKLVQRVGLMRREIDKRIERARRGMSERLAERAAEAMNRAIAEHGLEGETARQFYEAARDVFGQPKKVSEGLLGVLGGLVGGMGVGLSADIMAGGMTLGGGAIVGGVAGGASAFLLARGYNLVRGEDNRVRWTREHFREEFQLALLCYLAVAHFGRGRGEWEDSDAPVHWEGVVKKVVEWQGKNIDDLWKRGGKVGVEMEEIEVMVEAMFAACARKALLALYPGAGAFDEGA
jgi:hypothetical protein